MRYLITLELFLRYKRTCCWLAYPAKEPRQGQYHKEAQNKGLCCVTRFSIEKVPPKNRRARTSYPLSNGRGSWRRPRRSGDTCKVGFTISVLLMPKARSVARLDLGQEGLVLRLRVWICESN